MIKAGATPKLIMSVNESSSLPTFEVPFINLAILPSNPSITAAKIIAIIANSNLPSNANLIEVKPIQTPIRVSILGKIILAFLSLIKILSKIGGLSLPRNLVTFLFQRIKKWSDFKTFEKPVSLY